jgi:NOL1/NOP2/fmu family ribosome biogenesis protein
MLIPGGRICYSTCTFARLEDEEAVSAFLSRHPDMTLMEERRLWPQQVKGEGHYAALLEKADTENRGEVCRENRSFYQTKKINDKILNDYLIFTKGTMNDMWRDNLLLLGDLLYQLPDNCPDFDGLHVLRGGLFLGTLKKNRFEPGHAMALAVNSSEVKNSFNLTSDSQEIQNYLKGQSIIAAVPDGWTLITVDGYSIGWGKAVKGQIKNHYPKGLRILG